MTVIPEDNKDRRQMSSLRWKGTFIDINGTEEGQDLSPRAHSDSGSELSSSSNFFQNERTYVEQLSERLSLSSVDQNWTNNAKDWKNFRKTSSYDDGGDSSSITGSHNIDEVMSMGVEGPPEMPPCEMQDMMLNPGCTLVSTSSLSSKDIYQAQETMSGSHPGHQTLKPGVKLFQEDHFRNARVPSTAQHKEELRRTIHKQTKEMKQVLHLQRLSSALTVIEEIPEQVGDVLQQSVSSLAGELQGEVAVMREMIRDRENQDVQQNAERAVARLETIPDLILNSFEASFARAKDAVRQRVDGVIEDLECGNNLAKDQIVYQMLSIPGEVQQIAGQAVEEAVQVSKVHAKQQIDCVLQSLPQACESDDLWRCKWQMVAKVPNVYPDTLRKATAAVVDTVEVAVAEVNKAENDSHDPGGSSALTNQVVADALLRAKACKVPVAMASEFQPPESSVSDKQDCVPYSTEDGDMLPTEDTQEMEPVTNPGSVGHPELCPRPCLYYPLGKCVNGNECEFCHLSHPKRPAHLDKRHREMLKGIPFEECAAMVLPILKEKAKALKFGPEVMEMLDNLAAQSVGAVPSSARRGRNTRMLQIALKAMSLRSLLTTLLRTASPEGASSEDPPTRAAVDNFLHNLRARC